MAVPKNQMPYTIHRGADGTQAVATCRDCKAERAVTLTKNAPPDRIIKWLAQDGWEIEGHQHHFKCPDCLSKPADTTTGELTVPTTKHYHDPDTGETGVRRIIKLRASAGQQKGLFVSIPYQTWCGIGSPKWLIANETDDGMLVIRGMPKGAMDYEHAAKVTRKADSYEAAKAYFSCKRLPHTPKKPTLSTHSIEYAAFMLPDQHALVIAIDARNIFKTLAQAGTPKPKAKQKTTEQPMPQGTANEEGVVPIREDAGPPLNPTVDHAQLLARGCEIRHRLNQWIRSMKEEGFLVDVTQDRDEDGTDEVCIQATFRI